LRGIAGHRYGRIKSRPIPRSPPAELEENLMSDAAKQSSTNPITELKVSGHLMTMEEGLFCVYNTPGSAPPDAATGLPGVRLTPAPGQGGFSGKVSISGFGGDGWLAGADGAALVRILGGAAQVLVTVYQAADGAHDAPKLQVIRLTDDMRPAEAVQAAPSSTQAAEPAPQQPETGLPVEVAAHIYGRGDVGGRLGDWMGEPGSKRWIEGFGLAPSTGVAAADIEYQAVLGRGWLSPWAEGGQFCGSRGMSLPILGLRVRLRGAAAQAYKASVSATFVDGAKVGPVSDGGACEAPSLSPLEAFNVSLLPIGAAASAPAAKPTAGRMAKPPATAPAPLAAPAVQAPEPAKAVRRGKTPAVAAPLSEPQMPIKPAKRGKSSAPALTAPPPEPQKPELSKPGPSAPIKPAAKAPTKRTPATTRRR
jgi:hypothetical protein